MNNFERYEKLHQLNVLPSSILKKDIWVVIPCNNEPNIKDTLMSLFFSNRNLLQIGIIVVVNSKENADEGILVQNENTIKELGKFSLEFCDNSFHLEIIHLIDVKKKHAGVGMARKYGMDLAAIHHHHHGDDRGIIVSLDADCTVELNYFREIFDYFKKNDKIDGASIYFEHPIDYSLYSSANNDAIILYEIYLRYFVSALRYIQYPFAYYTIGSAFAVRTSIYINQGGMNKKNAGEDFYFLHKIIPLGNYGRINKTCVYPSSRISDRVIFGTGPAVKKIITEGVLNTYPLDLFEELLPLVKEIELIYNEENWDTKCHMRECLRQFLIEVDFKRKVAVIRKNTSNINSFSKKYFKLFNVFMIVKFLNFGVNSYYSLKPVVEEVVKINSELIQKKVSRDILNHLRLQEKRD